MPRMILSPTGGPVGTATSPFSEAAARMPRKTTHADREYKWIYVLQ